MALTTLGAVVVAFAVAIGGGDGKRGSRAQTAATSYPAPAAGSHTPRAKHKPVVKRLVITPPHPGQAHIYFKGAARREVALTIDDGICPPCVKRLVAALMRTGAHATIFPNGVHRSSWDPEAANISKLVSTGQLTVGNHTFSHHDPRAESSSAFGQDLSANERWIEQTFGISARPWFRPPYGSYNSGTLTVAGQLGYTKVILWSGTVADSSVRSIPYILHAIRQWARPGAVILMHGNFPATSIALPRILAILRAKHLRPVTIAELLGSRT